LVALVSAYRYEGSKFRDDAAKSEAETLSNAIKNGKPIEDDEVIRILATRSKPHLQAIYKHYMEISGQNIDEVLNSFCFWLLLGTKFCGVWLGPVGIETQGIETCVV
jgi:hypothetical protein